MFVAALALSEVPATVLLSPQQPQMLVPLLMTWVHMLRYDPMIEASLVTAMVVVVVGFIAVLLIRLRRKPQIANPNDRSVTSAHAPIRIMTLVIGIYLACAGCDARSVPKDIWLETGAGPGQVVYPRGITYSPADNTFFVVDRAAHVQHQRSRPQRRCIRSLTHNHVRLPPSGTELLCP